MSGGGRVEDKSDEVARIQAEEARLAREAEARREQQRRDDFIRSLEGAYGSSVNDAMRFFESQGLDPSQYSDVISSAALSKKQAVPMLDSNPAAYFANLGQEIFNQQQTGARSTALRQLQQLLPQGFERERISDSVDDSLIESILGERRTDATQYAENLASRGVITGSALAAAMREIEDQAARARTNLSQIGQSVLERGRSGLRDIFGEAQTRANNLNLGEQFNPDTYRERADSSVQNFFSSLGDSIRGAAPSDLFDTSRILNFAGRSQGAQNTAFNPAALLGIPEDDDQQQTPQRSPFGSF